VTNGTSGNYLYGPNGECICFDCGMKDEKTTERMMVKVLFGDEQQGENYV